MKKALFIINPNSGVDRIKEIQYLIKENLSPQKFSYELVYTQFPKHGTQLARSAVERGFEVIVAVGGDGSVNDVINGIYGTDAILAILPKGSGNGLARSLGIPLNTRKAIQLMNAQNTTEIDLGDANGHIFSSTAGVGFDALVAKKFAANKRRGFVAYSWIITKYLWSYKLYDWLIEVDEKQFKEKAFMLTVANAIQLGYGFKIAPAADLKDGFFDIIILKKFPVLMAFLIAFRAFRGTLLKSRYVDLLRAKEVTISHAELHLFQFDGEAAVCDQQIKIKMLPKALKILVAE